MKLQILSKKSNYIVMFVTIFSLYLFNADIKLINGVYGYSSDDNIRKDVYYLISGIIGAAGIIGAFLTFSLTKQKLHKEQLIVGKKIKFIYRLKEKIKNKTNMTIVIIYFLLLIFTLTALPFLINPSNLADAWITNGLIILLGLGTPITIIVLITLFYPEIKSLKIFYPRGETASFGLILDYY